MNDENDKYLDPQKNPMIQTQDLEFGGGMEKRGEIIDDLDGLAPFEVVPGPEATPERLAERLQEAFSNQNEIEIEGNIRILRTAAGGFMTEKGIRIGDLSGSARMKISDSLRDRGK